LSNRTFSKSFSKLFVSVHRAVARLHLTGWWLGAAAAFPHYLSNPHFPPPLRQTARYLLAFYREFCPFHYFVRYSTQFNYFVIQVEEQNVSE
jgi:hypothetical protein